MSALAVTDPTPSQANGIYALNTGDSGASRLRLLDQVYGPATRRMLLDSGLAPGMRVLDLACGIGAVTCWLASQVGDSGTVTAADVSPEQLVVAKSTCKDCDHPATINYIQASACATDLPADSFDIVHMRLLLCHLDNPAQALLEAHRVLKPGGALVCQDLRLSSLFCSPASPAYTRIVQYAHSMGNALGVDYDYGVRLPADALHAGFQSVEVRLDQPAYMQGPEKSLWELTFREVAPVMVRTRAATQVELDLLFSQMRLYADDPTSLIAQACLPGIIARK
jgi:ubiquinone/menaquinone biosynthesis C-methylase UbiE